VLAELGFTSEEINALLENRAIVVG
ncbi:MAG: hypothetical protein ACI9OJ_004441, partial [Myxococcota bacterium]